MYLREVLQNIEQGWQKNWAKFSSILRDLHVARASARCEISANVLLWSNSKHAINWFIAYFIKLVEMI